MDLLRDQKKYFSGRSSLLRMYDTKTPGFLKMRGPISMHNVYMYTLPRVPGYYKKNETTLMSATCNMHASTCMYAYEIATCNLNGSCQCYFENYAHPGY